MRDRVPRGRKPAVARPDRCTLITYGKRALDRAEVFAPGALQWPADGIILNMQHDRQAPIMRFTPELDGAELRIDAALPDTQRGRDAATMVRNGTFTGLSIEFRRGPRAGPLASGKSARRTFRRRRWSTRLRTARGSKSGPGRPHRGGYGSNPHTSRVVGGAAPGR